MTFGILPQLISMIAIYVVCNHFARFSEGNHRMWTDSYLAAFALASKSRLVSFDGDFNRFAGLDFLHLKHMPPAYVD
jgi:predicted nucleic acid-binding protein